MTSSSHSNLLDMYNTITKFNYKYVYTTNCLYMK